MSKYVKSIFAKAFAEATPVIFNPLWANGTGYFDFAVKGEHAPVVEEGKSVSSLSLDDREIVMIGTRFGNVVVFQRYADKEKGIYVNNLPDTVKKLFNGMLAQGQLDEDSIAVLLGDSSNARDNIGQCYKRYFPAVIK